MLVLEDIVINSLLTDRVREVLERLTEEEQRLLTLRFGFDTGVALSYAEVARQFSVNRYYIEKLEQKVFSLLSADDDVKTLWGTYITSSHVEGDNVRPLQVKSLSEKPELDLFANTGN